MRVYVASSWRNEAQPAVVKALREAGHEVYDFRNPEPGNDGFRWFEIDPNWQGWSPEEFREFLNHPTAVKGYLTDMSALQNADACVLVMPSGRSAHLEAGFAIGAGKPTAILLSSGEPELMYSMAACCIGIEEVVEFINNCCHYLCKGGWNVPVMDICTHGRNTSTGV